MPSLQLLRRPRSPVHLLRQIAAAVLACLALVLALRAPPPPTGGLEPGRATVPVAVAATDLAAGTVLTVDDLEAAPFPVDVVPAGVARAPDELSGQVLAAPVRAGEAVTDARVVGPGLWSEVPEGQVAAPVRLADLAVASLLRAGDRVDVLATAADAADGGVPPVVFVAEGALVLSAPAPPTDDSPVPGAGDGTGLLVLAVDPATAQRLAAAAAGGNLTVTLGRP